jgi:hypothetical protein
VCKCSTLRSAVTVVARIDTFFPPPRLARLTRRSIKTVRGAALIFSSLFFRFFAFTMTMDFLGVFHHPFAFFRRQRRCRFLPFKIAYRFDGEPRKARSFELEELRQGEIGKRLSRGHSEDSLNKISPRLASRAPRLEGKSINNFCSSPSRPRQKCENMQTRRRESQSQATRR